MFFYIVSMKSRWRLCFLRWVILLLVLLIGESTILLLLSQRFFYIYSSYTNQLFNASTFTVNGYFFSCGYGPNCVKILDTQEGLLIFLYAIDSEVLQRGFGFGSVLRKEKRNWETEKRFLFLFCVIQLASSCLCFFFNLSNWNMIAPTTNLLITWVNQ